MNRWLAAVRNAASVKEWWKFLASKMRGHYAYYGVTDNSRSIAKYYLEVIILVHKWLNRRSQRKSMNWEGYEKYLEKFPLPKPRIVHKFSIPYKLCQTTY